MEKGRKNSRNQGRGGRTTADTNGNEKPPSGDAGSEAWLEHTNSGTQLLQLLGSSWKEAAPVLSSSWEFCLSLSAAHT